MAKIELSNSRAFLIFLGIIFGISMLNIWLILSVDDDNLLMTLFPYFNFLLISVALLVLQPNIIAFTIIRVNNSLQINSGLSEEHSLIIKGEDIFDYKLDSKVMNYAYNLVIFKRGSKGIMKSPDFRIVFFSEKDLDTLVKYLELNKQNNRQA
jgi:hypothetical protein